jgi:hypothetical protein
MGHALVAHCLDHTDPVHKISVISRGQALGYTISLPTEDTFLTTRYKAIRPEEEAAAELAVALLRGEQPPAGLVNARVDNGEMRVPTVLLEPKAVTKENVEDTVVADGFWSVEQICTLRYKKACEAAGIE